MSKGYLLEIEHEKVGILTLDYKYISLYDATFEGESLKKYNKGNKAFRILEITTTPITDWVVL